MTMSYTPDLSKAPLPDERTLRKRNSFFYQVGRFIALDFKMMKVIFKKSH